jgi:hypothetical protein
VDSSVRTDGRLIGIITANFSLRNGTTVTVALAAPSVSAAVISSERSRTLFMWGGFKPKSSRTNP